MLLLVLLKCSLHDTKIDGEMNNAEDTLAL